MTVRRRPLGSVGPDAPEEILPDDALMSEVVVQFADLSRVRLVRARGLEDGERTRRRERMSSISR